MSNLIEDLRAITITELGQAAHERWERLRDTVAAYDALAPDWATAPEWGRWCAIDADGNKAWWEHEPSHKLIATEWWIAGGCRWRSAGMVVILPGLDWRLCVWQRPPAQEPQP